MTAINTGEYGADDDLVDYILGITFEIWEQGNVDLINQYYGPSTVVWALDGITHGATEMIAGTNAMLQAFPDRLLLGDDVIGNLAGTSAIGVTAEVVDDDLGALLRHEQRNLASDTAPRARDDRNLIV